MNIGLKQKEINRSGPSSGTDDAGTDVTSDETEKSEIGRDKRVQRLRVIKKSTKKTFDSTKQIKRQLEAAEAKRYVDQMENPQGVQ